MRATPPILLAALVAAAASAALAAANAETFVLKSGETIEGTVLRAAGNTVTIKLQQRGMVQTPIRDLQRVEIKVRGGEAVGGSLSAWSAGTYLLDTDQGLVAIKDGQIVEDEPGDTAVAKAEEPAAGDSNLKQQFQLFLAQFPQESLAELQKDEIFERFLQWQRANP
jgi:hypothetical protein